VEPLLYGVVFPLLCYDDEDDDNWRNDPQEYIRKVRWRGRGARARCGGARRGGARPQGGASRQGACVKLAGVPGCK
jgi:hypothetical protein